MSNPLVAQAQDSTRWYTGMGLVEDVAGICSGIHDDSWVDVSLGGVGAALDTLSAVLDPLGALVSWGVGWLMEHVKPLKDGLDWLAGNADEVAAHAATWQNVARFTEAAAQDYVARLQSEVATWFGASADAYRGHAAMHVRVLEAMSLAAQGISYAVEGAGLLVGLVRGIVRDLIAEFVATLAARLPEWLAEAGLTVGIASPLVISQVSALVAKWVNKIQHFIRGLLRSLARLHPKLGKLGEALTGLSRYSDDLAGGSPHGPTGGSSPTPAAPTGWHEGDPLPPPRTGEVVPTDAKLGEHYKYEADPNADPAKKAFPWSTVEYLSEAKRERYRLFVDGDGLLRNARTGKLFDSTGGSSVHSGGSGRAIFVMDGSGNLYASLNQEVGVFHHSSFLAGADTAGAGEIKVVDGRLTEFTDRSGHYRPAPAVNDQAFDALRGQGLQPSDDFQKFDFNNRVR